MRGQIALWMLTKFAMIFFILALSLILVGVADRQNRAICEEQANSQAQSIASSIVNIVNAPVEDESKVVSLDAGLGAGKESYQKYTVNLTKRVDASGVGSIIVEVNTGGGCKGGARAGFDANTEVRLSTMTLTPSNPSDRTRFLVLIKCQPKTLLGNALLKRQVFFDNCKNPDVSRCKSLSTTGDLGLCCGWGSSTASAVQAACNRAG